MSVNVPVYRGKNPFLPGAEFLRNPFKFTSGPGLAFSDFYRVKFLLRRIYVTTNLEVIRHVLQANQKNYRKSIAYRNLKMALGNGLVTNEGEDWKRNRRLIQPAFYKKPVRRSFSVYEGSGGALLP